MPYEKSPVFIPAAEGSPIWRYMDFTKLVSMLVERSLFFCRADRLDDRFEGSMSRASVRARDESVSTRLPEFHEAELRRTYINSWSMGRYESDALWRVYVGTRDGVAVRSTFGRLARSLDAEERPVHIGRVEYIDYDNDSIPEDHVLHPFVFKRRSFDYERELRAVTQIPAAGDAPGGLLVPCDLKALVTAIRVSPAAEPWFASLVRSVLKTYDLNVPVEESDLLADPVY